MNYTSREESKDLLELGINKGTSNLVYVPGLEFPSVLPGVKFSVIEEKIKQKYQDAAIPAWTTDALIKLLPKKINSSYQLLIFPDLTTDMWVAMYDEIGTHTKVLEACGDSVYKKAILKLVKWVLKEKEGSI